MTVIENMPHLRFHSSRMNNEEQSIKLFVAINNKVERRKRKLIKAQAAAESSNI